MEVFGLSRKIQIKRGLEIHVPQLDVGEQGFTTDSKKLFIGSNSGNIEYAKKTDLDIAISAVTVDSEVVLARNGETTLDARLDKMQNEMDVYEEEVVLARKGEVTLGVRLDKLLGVTNKKAFSSKLPHYDEELGEYVNLEWYWQSLREGKVYTTEFTKFDVSPNPIGTKKDDNEGLIAVPSTNTIKGQDDYVNIGLFKPIDVNGYVDENDDYHVTAIEGDGRFANDGSNGDVWVMNMVGYLKYYETDTTWGVSYSDVLQPDFEVISEAVKPDGSIRPYLLHAKYIAGRNPVDGKLASISGVYAEYVNMSHNGQITEFKAKGNQYSGKTTHDDFWAQLMFWLKYANTNNEAHMKGCISYHLQYVNKLVETGVNRVVVTTSQANNLVVGSTVSIGDYGTGTISTDGQSTQNYNKANRVTITSIEDLGNGDSAVYVDSPVFDTTLTTTITTYPWNAGSCDDVLGVDGSPTSVTSGKEPFIINGIEMMVGGYEVLQNVIIYNDNSDPLDYKIQVWACYDCTKYATSITADYDLVGYELAQTNNSWQYIKETKVDPNHPSILVATQVGASSTTGYGDGLYTDSPTTGTRVWLSLGYLNNGSLAGLRCLGANGSLGSSYWAFLARMSGTGRSRRRAG